MHRDDSRSRSIGRPGLAALVFLVTIISLEFPVRSCYGEVLFSHPWANFLDICSTGNSGFCLSGLGGSVWNSADDGVTWTASTTGLHYEWLNGVYFLDAQHGWAAGSDGTVLSTRDGGQSWTGISIDGAALNDVYFLTSDVGFACGINGLLIRTDDGGRSWTPVQTSTSEVLNRFAVVPGTTKIWIVGGHGTVLSSPDEGKSWQKRSSGVVTTMLYDCLWIDERHGWICGQNGTLLSTDDAGDSWIAHELKTEQEFCTVSFCSRNVGIIAGGSAEKDSEVFFTTDGGVSWSILPGYGQSWWKSALSAGNNRFIVVGNDRVISISIHMPKTSSKTAGS